MRGADAFEVRDRELPLIDAALAEDDVPGLEPQFRRLDVGDLTPAANSQRVGVEMLEPDVALNAGLCRVVDPVVDQRAI